MVFRQGFYLFELTTKAKVDLEYVTRCIWNDLLVIVFTYHSLDSLRTSHCSFPTHECSDGTQTKSCYFGHVCKQSRPDSMLHLKFIHHRQMFLFLVPHLLHYLVKRKWSLRSCIIHLQEDACLGVLTKHRYLTHVYPIRGYLPGLVDSERCV